MKLEKLLISYEQFISAITSDWQNQVAQAQSEGDNYFIGVRARYGWIPSALNMVREDFQKQNRNVDWLKMFLTENLVLSQTEPICLDQKEHTWYLTAWHYRVSDRDTMANRKNRFISKKSYDDVWLYQDVIYGINGEHSRDEQKLLILEYADKERRKFERLKNKFSAKQSEELKYERARIPEEVRIAVWRRDQGRCARCGNRENLEYDHIVPVSKGGGNTERNIELLCQDCNRAKGNRIE
jgi:hypothetical protein